MNSYASFPIIVRRGLGPGEIQAVCFNYTKRTLVSGEVVKSFTAVKFPAETGESGETPWGTALNGARLELSETPDSPEGFELRSFGPLGKDGEPEPFLVCRVPGEKGVEWHDKIVFLVRMNSDSVRLFRKEEKPDGPDEVLGVPEFVELGELWRRMYERGVPFHRAILYRVIRYFVNRYPTDICSKYKGILGDPRSQDLLRGRDGLICFTGDNE